MLDYITAEKVARTERLDIFVTRVEREPSLGCPRDVYMAWFHSADVPRSVCEVTIWSNFIEWIHTCEHYRRQGIATEMLAALEDLLGPLVGEGVTEEGEGFCEAFKWMDDSASVTLPESQDVE